LAKLSPDKWNENHTEITKLLLENGCSLTAKNNPGGNTPLHLAASNGNINFLDAAWEVKSGSFDLDVLNQRQNTPLDVAKINEKSNVVAWIRKKVPSLAPKPKNFKKIMFAEKQVGFVKAGFVKKNAEEEVELVRFSEDVASKMGMNFDESGRATNATNILQEKAVKICASALNNFQSDKDDKNSFLEVKDLAAQILLMIAEFTFNKVEKNPEALKNPLKIVRVPDKNGKKRNEKVDPVFGFGYKESEMYKEFSNKFGEIFDDELIKRGGNPIKDYLLGCNGGREDAVASLMSDIVIFSELVQKAAKKENFDNIQGGKDGSRSKAIAPLACVGRFNNLLEFDDISSRISEARKDLSNNR